MSQDLNLRELSASKHKDTTPDTTIQRIRGILSELKIETRESVLENQEINTCSLRLSLKDSSAGSNGKGMSREFARASAYAEFIERLQNNKMAANATFNNVLHEKENDHYIFTDESFLSAEELVREENAFLRFFFQTRTDDERQCDKSELLRRYQKLDYNVHRTRDFLCVPYFSVCEKKDVYIPYFMQNMFYGSNGMCAGNTIEEALVQGLSEIFERRVQKELIMKQRCLPDIPESYIRKYEDIYRMYQTVKRNRNFNIYIKDGSLGGRYPVCVLVIADKNSGWFGVKMGSHPDYHIAMERLFTEATQGIDLKTFSKKSYLLFSNSNVSNVNNLQNSFKTGDAAYPYQLFGEDYDYPFVKPRDFTGADNQEMLSYAVNIIRQEGYDLLIHDASYLGFPSYHIIVPGFSEMNVATKNDFEADNTRYHVQKLVYHPELINEKNVPYLISDISYYQHALQSNTLTDFAGYHLEESCTGSKYGVDLLYFKAMLYVYEEDYERAFQLLELILRILEDREISEDEMTYFRAVRSYLEGMVYVMNHREVISCLRKLYDERYVNRLDDYFKDAKQALVKQYRGYDRDYRTRSYQMLLELTEKYVRSQEKSRKRGNEEIRALGIC